MRLFLALRAFFRVLFDGNVAQQVAGALEYKPTAEGVGERKKDESAKRAPVPTKIPIRSDALTLLATLQREARFVDIVQEPLSNYSDAQVGAAARDVLRDCAGVLDRLFALRPLTEQEEGSEIEAPQGYDTGRFRVTGNVQGEPPFRGTLAHHGWLASQCELPKWSGSEAAANVIAPVELEVK